MLVGEGDATRDRFAIGHIAGPRLGTAVAGSYRVVIGDAIPVLVEGFVLRAVIV